MYPEVFLNVSKAYDKFADVKVTDTPDILLWYAFR